MAEQFVLSGHQSATEAGQLLATFWPRVTNDIRTKPLQVSKTGSKKDEPIQELPLARIKKIMKQDGDVKMISAEAPILFSKAAEIFISELSLRAWIHTEDNKRRTLQRNDIAMAITKYDQFDFLIDIVPRDELKPVKRHDDSSSVRQGNVMGNEEVQYYFQIPNLTHQQQQQQQQQQTQQTNNQQNNSNTPAAQIAQLPAGTQIFQQPNGQVIIAAQPHQLAALTGGAVTGASPPQLLQIAANENNEKSESSNTQASTQQNSSLIQSQNEVQAAPQVQYAGGTPQIQFVRIPQNVAGSNSSNVGQVIGIQASQLGQSAATSTADTNNSQATPQMYQNMHPGVPVYVMAEQANNASSSNVDQSGE